MNLHRSASSLFLSAALLALSGASANANGLNPGSLLLFPQYDTQPGRDTLLTLTNTATSGGNVIVHLFFVDGTGTPTTTLCTRTGFDIPLSPGDTFTGLASAFVANKEGYAYAYAVNAQGAAVSFNFLIGDEIVTDGTFALDYAVNPVSFEAIRSIGQLTDRDNDGERDLDGRVLDVGGDHHSSPGQSRIR